MQFNPVQPSQLTFSSGKFGISLFNPNCRVICTHLLCEPGWASIVRLRQGSLDRPNSFFHLVHDHPRSFSLRSAVTLLQCLVSCTRSLLGRCVLPVQRKMADGQVQPRRRRRSSITERIQRVLHVDRSDKVWHQLKSAGLALTKIAEAAKFFSERRSTWSAERPASATHSSSADARGRAQSTDRCSYRLSHPSALFSAR